MSMFWLAFAYVGLGWSLPMFCIALVMMPCRQVKVTAPSEEERVKKSFFRRWNKWILFFMLAFGGFLAFFLNFASDDSMRSGFSIFDAAEKSARDPLIVVSLWLASIWVGFRLWKRSRKDEA